MPAIIKIGRKVVTGPVIEPTRLEARELASIAIDRLRTS